MGRIHRLRTALSRHHRSAGFGIHSPFAFNFVCNVLGERLPYYGYAAIEATRRVVVEAGMHRLHHAHVISLSNAKMLFRIVNYFAPRHILQFGTNHGVTAVTVLLPSSAAQLCLCEPLLGSRPLASHVLQPYMNRIHVHSDASSAIAAYCHVLQHDQPPFVLVNEITDENAYKAIEQFLYTILDDKGIIVMRNLNKDKQLKQLWASCERYVHAGQSFTNEKIGIIVATPKLQPERFNLWF